MMLDATSHYDQPLTAERLCAWHACLFPTARSGMRKIRVGAWRDDSTGPMQALLDWFNDGGVSTDLDAVLKAGLAHLWFVTIHPFDDGNGRIARAMADLALARSEHSPQRFYSMSAQIRQEHAQYYEILEQTRRARWTSRHG